MSIRRFPTFADVHVHLREPGAIQKEDFETGTKAAIAGGYTQVLDMPNNNPPTISDQRLIEKVKATTNRIWCDIGFNFGATKESVVHFSKIANKVFAAKVYMNQTTGPLLVGSSIEREKIFKNWTSDKPLMVHAEDGTAEEAINLAIKYKKRLHICHVTLDQITLIKKARKSGLKISCEVTPHHLFLSSEDIETLGNFAVMKPPLMSKKDKNKLWSVIDQIDMISTDHAPHTIKEKTETNLPVYGVPGLETTFPLMMHAVKEGLVTEERVIEMLAINPRKIFELPYQPNTYFEAELSEEYEIANMHLYTKCQWTPFRDMNGLGVIKKVVLRGSVVYENGKFSHKPSGKVMRPLN